MDYDDDQNNYEPQYDPQTGQPIEFDLRGKPILRGTPKARPMTPGQETLVQVKDFIGDVILAPLNVLMHAEKTGADGSEHNGYWTLDDVHQGLINRGWEEPEKAPPIFATREPWEDPHLKIIDVTDDPVRSAKIGLSADFDEAHNGKLRGPQQMQPLTLSWDEAQFGTSPATEPSLEEPCPPVPGDTVYRP